MFQNIDKRQVVYLYDYVKKVYIQKFPTVDDALKFLASVSYISYIDHSFHNVYLDDTNITGNDIKVVNEFFCDSYEKSFKVYLRSYVFVFEDLTVIDFREKEYLDKIKYYFEISDFSYKYYLDNNRVLKRIRRLETHNNNKTNYEYRKDPVPYQRHFRHYHKYRKFSIMSEVRANADPEIQEYIRFKRKSSSLLREMHNSFCRSRCGSKSWKDCTKKKKQWM